MVSLMPDIRAASFGRRIRWNEVGHSLYGEIEGPLRDLSVTIYRSPMSDAVVVLDNGSIGRLGKEIPDSLWDWHCRDGIYFRECSDGQVTNAVRDLVQAIEETALRDRVRPNLCKAMAIRTSTHAKEIP